MIHFSDPDMFGWEAQSEDRQLAAINYENGRENLILSVDVANLSGQKAVWIFPVPAGPEETRIDIIKGFPRLMGYDVKQRVDTTLSSGFTFMTFSQVYTTPFLLLMLFGGGMQSIGGLGGMEDIEVYQHIEKMGLTTELVTAKDGNALDSYLNGKGVTLPSSSKAILDEYVGKDYSFVVSWISDVGLFKNQTQTRGMYPPWYGKVFNTLGVYISFPTDKMYFPLKPTSIYGNSRIPIIVYVIGHVTPEIYPGISPYSQVNYFASYSRFSTTDFQDFFNYAGEMQDFKYTKIKIEAPSSLLRQDLWIEDKTPPDLAVADYVNNYFWMAAIFLFILISCMSSLIAGMVVFGKANISKIKFALFGLANFATLVGLTFLAHALKIDRNFTSKKSKANVDYRRLILGAAIIGLAAGLIILNIFIAPMIFGYFAWMIIGFFAGIISLLLFASPLIMIALAFWSYEKNKQITRFLIMFTVIFMVLAIAFSVIFTTVF
jgi:hypothetical protein